MKFEPSQVQYIKLGKGGGWAREAIDKGTLPFGYPQVDHDLCVAGAWGQMRDQLVAAGWSKRGTSSALREISRFYKDDPETLWITFADGHLWWAFADGDVTYHGQPEPNTDAPTRCRQIAGDWRNTALDGTSLTLRTLSSALTRTAGYRGTICDVEAQAYLLRRIRGQDDPRIAEARALQEQLIATTTALVLDLDWRDWEILIDLIMTRAGWRRVSAIGDGETDIDLLLEHPTTGDNAWVQIKTGTSQAELGDYIARYKADGSCDRFFYVCHGPDSLTLPYEDTAMHLWRAGDVAAQAIEAGLIDWIMERHA